MTIKIEVSGNSTAELADKLLALAATFNPAGGIFTAPSAPVEDKPKPKRMKTEAAKDAAAPEPVTDVVETVSSQSDTAAAQPETTANAATSTSTTASAESSASEPLDFDKDVAPHVIAMVGKKGKPAVAELLEQFGATRASEVNEEQWPELVAQLKAAIA